MRYTGDSDRCRSAELKTTMSIQRIVERVLAEGYLTPIVESEIGLICETATHLSVEEYAALERLMEALMNGTVTATHRKQFINVMEELVLSEAIVRVSDIETTSDRHLDLGDIAAYALNRLPPLYATTEEGAVYQRQRAKTELRELITERVREAIAHHLDRMEVFQQRQALGTACVGEAVGQISALLQSHAASYEPPSRNYNR